jgi:kynurenine formamidase
MPSEQQPPKLSHILASSPKTWGKWGDSDEVGALNYLGSAEVLRGIGAVRQGRVFTLQTQMLHPDGDPLALHRRPPQRLMFIDEGTWAGDKAPDIPGGAHFADDFLMTFLQGSTQYDALGHVWFDGQLYNGYDANTTIGGLSRASVLPIAQKGVVGRAVLIDIARHRGKRFLARDEGFDHQDIEAAAAAQGVRLEKRDILIVRTGWVDFFYETSKEEFYKDACEPGLVYSPALVDWFLEMEIPNLVTDTIGNEIGLDPNTGAQLTLHSALMRNLGVVFTEICDLAALAEDCASDGQWSFLYAAAPLKVTNASGSPVNPIVIK